MDKYIKEGTLYVNKTEEYHTYLGGYGKKKFYPEFRLEKLNNEFNFDISFFDNTNIISDANYYVDKNNKIIFSNGDTYTRLYPVNNKFGEQNEFEYEIGFKNLLAFTEYCKLKKGYYEIKFKIKNKGLIYIWQGDEDDKDSARPDKVVGSFAVYYDGKKHNKYKCGKFGHLYTFYIFDANGKKYKCELKQDSIKGNTLTIYIKQDIIESVLFPIIIDPTFGYTSVGGTTRSLRSFDYTGGFTLSEAGTLSNVVIYINNQGTQNLDLKAAVWLQSDDTLVDNNISTGIVTPGADWRTVTMNSVALSATNYWLGGSIDFSASGDTLIYYDSSTGVPYAYQTRAYNGFPEDPMVYTESTGRYLSMYANYTTGGSSLTVNKSIGTALTGLSKHINTLQSELNKFIGTDI